ncbi:MAG: hypothetical protein A2073_03520 [Deltaproteobacteria bacterium GWC2_42_11]|nr:MAG: hypothetical protein A2073_03520 [Deltaproteobacteria bacterium GWC2_42_11]HBO84985.1 hypothetical protein [Deltaproteobacteria bacterium]
MFLSITLLSIVFVILLPENVYAWGPATHLELASDILHNINLLTPDIRNLLVKFPYDYLYGNISADIVVAKNLSEELKHCHNWKIGLNILRKASTPSQRSFAYGYLSHLAADTVAHNYYIPEKLILSFSSRILRHTYWELRFDAMADKMVWSLPRQIAREVYMDNDKLLNSVLEGTPLSFRTNKTIFSGILMIHRFEQWHRMLGLLSSSSKWKLTYEDKKYYYQLSLGVVRDFLVNGSKSFCVTEDPTGKARLATAKKMRRKLKTLKWNNKDWEGAVINAIQAIKQPHDI